MTVGSGGLSGGAIPDQSQMATSDWIFLAKNPEAVEAIMASFKAEQDRLDAKVALAGDADQIVTLRAQAEADRAQASQILSAAADKANEASGTASQVIVQAKEKADAIVAAADADSDRRGAILRDMELAATNRTISLDARENILADAAAKVVAREQAAEAAIAGANQAKASYEARQAALSAALKGV